MQLVSDHHMRRAGIGAESAVSAFFRYVTSGVTYRLDVHRAQLVATLSGGISATGGFPRTRSTTGTGRTFPTFLKLPIPRGSDGDL